MRRKTFLVCTIALILSLNGGSISGMAQDEDATRTATQSAAPVPCTAEGTVIPDCTLELLSSVPAEPGPDPDLFMQLLRIELAVGSAGVAVEHDGLSTLYVSSGLACFAVTEPDSPDASVEVRRPALDPFGDGSPTPAPQATTPPNALCSDYTDQCDEGCRLTAADGAVLLHAGDTATQLDESLQRYYGNAGTEPLVLFFTNLQPEGGNQAPCNGGCL